MNYTVYFWKRPNENRLYMSACPLEPDVRTSLRRQGYRIYEGLVVLPDEPDNPLCDESVSVAAKPFDDLLGRRFRFVEADLVGRVVRRDEKYVGVEWEGPFEHVGTFSRNKFEEKVDKGIFTFITERTHD